MTKVNIYKLFIFLISNSIEIQISTLFSIGWSCSSCNNNNDNNTISV